MYAAEALIRLNKINEAVRYLSPDAISDISPSVLISSDMTSGNLKSYQSLTNIFSKMG